MKKIVLCLILCICVLQLIQGQSYYQQFKDLPKPKKKWVLLHPFKAKKAYLVSNEVKRITDSIRKTKTIGVVTSGSKLDAFRHSFWMAYLSQEIGNNAAESLGKAHEKEGYLLYKKRKLEDDVLPDKASMHMDLHNNNIGLGLSSKKNKKTKKELILDILKAIDKGKMLIISRNKNQEFLSCDGKILEKENLHKNWDNQKCLVKSNTI